MGTEKSTNTPIESDDKISLADALVEHPPGRKTAISALALLHHGGRYPAYWALNEPEIQLFCNHESYNGFRFFECVDNGSTIPNDKWKKIFLVYRCKNCEETTKTYAIATMREGEAENGYIIKIGEWPPFGPHTPARVISLIGPDRDTFLKGRRSENQGLGIGAFAYYRRVVENQWQRLIDNIIKVAEKTSAPQTMIKQLNTAKQETHFSKAVEDIKDAIPQVLLINGHNPLKLLYKALSEGLHAKSDEDCLDIATSIRLVLTELSDRLSQALKDQAELDAAVSRLLQPKDNNSE